MVYIVVNNKYNAINAKFSVAKYIVFYKTRVKFVTDTTTDWLSLQSGRYVSEHDFNKATGLKVCATIPQNPMMHKCVYM